jgi:hypothetical protein
LIVPGSTLSEVSCLFVVLLVTGERDGYFPAWNCKNLSKGFPNAEFVSMKDYGHVPPEGLPEEFVEIIEDWLSRTLAIDLIQDEDS